ncbi:hypothetical protein GCM10010431_42460 [Streptomyces kunmingensis]
MVPPTPPAHQLLLLPLLLLPRLPREPLLFDVRGWPLPPALAVPTTMATTRTTKTTMKTTSITGPPSSSPDYPRVPRGAPRAGVPGGCPRPYAAKAELSNSRGSARALGGGGARVRQDGTFTSGTEREEMVGT